MNKYLTELIGTFFLVFTIGCTVISPGAGALAPLAIGAVLMVMVFAGGHISGANYNPAVSVAIWVRGKLNTKDLVAYIIFQLIGAVLAFLAVAYLKGCDTLTTLADATSRASYPVGPALLAEFLGTFALTFVVLNVATAKGTANNSFYGLAIGFTVTAMAYAVGGISGGAFNPAVALGITLMGLSTWANIWVFLLANIAAGIASGLAFKFLVTDKS
ncbi:MAG: aquaporin [Verrucomicrobiales bacterium]|jgi:aquaporin Z|nr:aquaporin [Verrucomicrobiales bacterium]